MATTNGNFHHQPTEGYTSASEAIPEQTTSGGTNHDLSKDEVGWYFVEQYYTTLSKAPEKLHLFYGKRSQFVYGQEAEVANVSVGRHAIQERIKQLDFQECKVRVSNVDSLSSNDNIVIQVIGETSTKVSPEPRKFAQTFVLAKQPSGYFVLNDVWRYINDEEEEQPEQATQEVAQADEKAAVATEPVAAPPATVEPTKVEQPKEEPVAPASPGPEPGLVDERLEEVAKAEEASAAKAKEASAATSKEGTPKSAPSEDGAAKEAAAEALKGPEKPHEPVPTPSTSAKSAAAAAAAAPAPPAEPEKPAKPMTWASRIAAAAGSRPAPALPKTATPPAPAQARAPAPAAAPKPAPAAKRTEPAQAAQEPATAAANEWQTAGGDSKRQNRPQSVAGQPDKEGTLGYVKYVTDKVQEEDLRSALTQYGSLTYFDINREKNCAFVEFATPEGYKAAVNANPHSVNGENIIVEQRRPKSTAYGGAQYAANRGGASGRGRGRYDGGRAGSQGGPKAPFGSQRGGRGGGAPRGKSSQPTNA